MDRLQAHAVQVEEAVVLRTADLFKLDVDLIFYDTTTCSFAIDAGDEDEETWDLRRLGHAKEGTWSPQVVVALAVTREGLPVRSWVFPGNTVDVTPVARIKDDLRGWKLGRSIFVADAGMNSEDTRLELARGLESTCWPCPSVGWPKSRRRCYVDPGGIARSSIISSPRRWS
jgi:transposase